MTLNQIPRPEPDRQPEILRQVDCPGPDPSLQNLHEVTFSWALADLGASGYKAWVPDGRASVREPCFGNHERISGTMKAVSGTMEVVSGTMKGRFGKHESAFREP